jgi:hypothetical protein
MASGTPPLTIQRFEALEGQIVTILASMAQILKVGDFALFPFTVEELPFGWYHRNNDRYDLDSAQGVALNGLSDPFKDHWSITIVNSTINVPTAYHTDGRPYFDRAVDGSTRLPGSVEGDAIRNIAGNDSLIGCRRKNGTGNIWTITGPYAVNVIEYANVSFGSTGAATHDIVNMKFDASLTVPTATENRPLNRGQTPGIYLGV